LKSIRIELPEFPYLRCLYYAFIKLIDLDDVDIRVVNNAVEVEARGDDIRLVLSNAIRYAVELGEDYKQRMLRSDFPLSGNDKKIFEKLKTVLSLGKDVSILNALEQYSSIIERINVNILQQALANQSNVKCSPFQAFLLETYSLTRAPFFNGKYKHKLKMNLHQMMICTAGYIAARHSGHMVMQGKDKKFITVLFLPINLKVTRYDFYKNIRKIDGLPGLSPEEAVILWIALHLPKDFNEDILVLGVEEPGRSMQLVSSITISNEFLLRAERLEKLREQQEYVKELLRYALRKGVERQPEIDDAIEYVKLLYLAVQKGFENEMLELALRSSRREASLTSTSSQDNTIKNRIKVAKMARKISTLLLKELA
jgi:hypothetical protein